MNQPLLEPSWDRVGCWLNGRLNIRTLRVSAEQVNDARQCLGRWSGSERGHAFGHLRIHLGARPRPTAQTSEIVTVTVPTSSEGSRLDDPPVSVTNGELPPTDEQTEQWFSGLRIAFEEEHLLQRPADDLRVLLEQCMQIADRGAGESHVGALLTRDGVDESRSALCSKLCVPVRIQFPCD